MNKLAEKLSERDKHPPKAVRNRYTFDSAIYPKHWQGLSDEALINQYRTNHNQLIVCYLLHRYKTPVVAISFSYLKNEEAVIDFTHDLYIKLVELLKHCDIQRFQSFLITIVKNKHKDELSKFRTVRNYEHNTDHPSVYEEENQRQFDIDNPFKPVLLERLKRKGRLSEMEYACIAMQLNGLKSGEIAELIDPSVLKLNPSESQNQPDSQILHLKKEKVYGAIERARKKLRKILQEDFGDYFKD